MNAVLLDWQSKCMAHIRVATALNLTLINQHSQVHVYLCFINIAFRYPDNAPICASCKRSGHVLLCYANRISDKQFVYMLTAPSFQPQKSIKARCL